MLITVGASFHLNDYLTQTLLLDAVVIERSGNISTRPLNSFLMLRANLPRAATRGTAT